jgi:23S rRNA (cytosine1962-C5)-methyltransferase
LRALQGGARQLVNVDGSEQALALLDQNVELNGFDRNRVENLHEDMFECLRRLHHEAQKFDVIILDPPKFVDSKAHLMRASRGYKDINRMAFLLLRPGGHLLTFSCSGLLAPELFHKIVADAALDAGRTGVILRQFHQSSDHPVRLSFPEGNYLKGLLVRVVE